MKALVVGSGPAGVSVALALLQNGHRVVMLDYANDIGAEALQAQRVLASQSKQNWCDEHLQAVKYPVSSKIAKKLLFADDFPYKDALTELSITLKNYGFYPSLAKGGLSNVWGAAVMPYIAQDIQNWPISIDELIPFYKKVNEFVNISVCKSSGIADGIINNYSYIGNETNTSIRFASKQIQNFAIRLNKNKNWLQTHGINVGFARNAMNANLCIECGLCMWGCPHNLIYNTKQTLEQLRQYAMFTYKEKMLVKTYREHSDGLVQLNVFNKALQKEEIFSGDKLFIAAGVLPTAKIVLESQECYQPIVAKQSAHFVFPIIDVLIGKRMLHENSKATLTEMFIEINNQSISNNTIHLQVYPYNDMILAAVKSKMGISYKLFDKFLEAVLRRVIAVQGFIHSDDSEKLHIQLSEKNEMQVSGETIRQSRRVKKIISLFSEFGFIPTYDISAPGRSYHCGGTFPMSSNSDYSEQFSTNKFGLLNGTKSVHIVDASVFPSIPAQTITYTVMANAYRIGNAIK